MCEYELLLIAFKPAYFDEEHARIELTESTFQGYYQNSVTNIVVETFYDMNKRKSMHEAAARLNALWSELRPLPEEQARDRFAEFLDACDYRIVLTVGKILKGDLSHHVPDVCQIVRVILWKNFRRMQERVYDAGPYVAEMSRKHAYRHIRKTGVITITQKVFSKDYVQVVTCEVEGCGIGDFTETPHACLVRKEEHEDAQRVVFLWKDVLSKIKYRAGYTAWTVLLEGIGLSAKISDPPKRLKLSPVARKCKVSREAVRRFVLRSIGRAERGTNITLNQFISGVCLCLL